MTLVRFSGAKSLRGPLVSQLLGEWAASSPLAKGRWAEATGVGFPSLIRTKQVEAVKQDASFLFRGPSLLGYSWTSMSESGSAATSRPLGSPEVILAPTPFFSPPPAVAPHGGAAQSTEAAPHLRQATEPSGCFSLLPSAPVTRPLGNFRDVGAEEYKYCIWHHF